jgi:hypothetical protein
MADAHIRALTARHPIMPISPRCPSAWQPKPGRRPTYRRGKSVQTTPQLSRITSFVTLLVSIVGLGAIVISYRTLKQADTSARVSAYQQMVSQSAGVEKLLVEHSAMRPYFRDSKPPTRGDKDYDLAAAIAEMRIDAFDALLTFPALMGFGSIGGWRNTVRDAFRDSPVMCDLVASYKDNYGTATVNLANEGCSPTAR